MMKSSPDRYGKVAVTIHWLSAALIVVLLATGFRASDAMDAASQASFLRVHIPVAIAIIALTLFRVIWWLFFDKKPAPVASSPARQEFLARAVHIAFYVIIFGMIASGIGMMVLSGAGPAIFGENVLALPNFADYAPRAPHGIGATLLVALLAAHIGAALYHQFIRKDGLIRRMWY